MGPPCKQRSQLESWKVNSLLQDQDYEEQSSTVSNRWDPVAWYSQHGYNVSEMIRAPGTFTFQCSFLKQYRLLWLLKILFLLQLKSYKKELVPGFWLSAMAYFCHYIPPFIFWGQCRIQVKGTMEESVGVFLQ